MIRLFDRILDVESRRQSATRLLAVLDGHGAVLALRHDLQRQAVLAREAHPHQPETQRLQDRRDDRRDARVDAALADETVVGRRAWRCAQAGLSPSGGQ